MRALRPRVHSMTERVLCVDDDATILRAYARWLAREGMSVETAPHADRALALLDARPFDVVVSDVAMPDVDGLDLLRAIRRRDLDLPVILVTGMPSVASALGANADGAYRYMVKPVRLEELSQTIREACKVSRLARLRRRTLGELGTLTHPIGDHAGLVAHFDAALDQLYMMYQPIVSWPEREIVGYEALVRSEEQSLPHPRALLDAAERLQRCHDLGRRVRQRAPEPIHGGDLGPSLFCNLSLEDLLDEHLFDEDAPLTRIASRVVLELTERAAFDRVPDVRVRAERLRALGFRIALDDLGAGYAGLNSFALLEPDIVKVDRELVSHIDASSTKRRLLRGLVEITADLGIELVAEGVETVAERDTLEGLGCRLMQGYLFSRPSRGLSTPQW